jgi:hypothetical protein
MSTGDFKKIAVNAPTTIKFLQVFNGIFNLTDNELRVLGALIDYTETINLCSSINKKKVAKELEIKDFNTLNNYVKRLKDKKAIIPTKDGYAVNPMLVPAKDGSVIYIKVSKDGSK